MCETCGCGDPELMPVEIRESLLAGNERSAAHNRDHFTAADVLTVNLMGSPGSGKTALLEATAASWKPGQNNRFCFTTDLSVNPGPAAQLQPHSQHPASLIPQPRFATSLPRQRPFDEPRRGTFIPLSASSTMA